MLVYVSKARIGWVSGKHPGYQAYDDGRMLSIEEENDMRTKLGMSPILDKDLKDNFQNWFNKKYGEQMDAYNKQVEKRGTFAETISKPKGDEYTVYVLEFDWNYGHEKADCKSKEEAEDRIDRWQKTFYWAALSNIKIYKEIRYKTEEKLSIVEGEED